MNWKLIQSFIKLFYLLLLCIYKYNKIFQYETPPASIGGGYSVVIVRVHKFALFLIYYYYVSINIIQYCNIKRLQRLSEEGILYAQLVCRITIYFYSSNIYNRIKIVFFPKNEDGFTCREVCFVTTFKQYAAILLGCMHAYV